MSIIVKNTTFPSLIDLLAPHSCRGCGRLGEPLCNCCKKYILSHNSSLCPICKAPTTHGHCQKHPDFPPFYNIGERNELLDTLIHAYKYDSVRALAPILAELLNAHLPKLPKSSVIVPLPTASNHIRSRGFDHTYKIAKHLAKLQHCQIQPLLIRTKNTVQVGADRKTRLAQAEQAFTIDSRNPINPATTYILFDDVWTTGASINAAIKKLRQAGARKIIVTLLAVSRLD